MYVELKSLFNREMKVYYVTQVTPKRCALTTCSFRNTKSHVLQIYICT